MKILSFSRSIKSVSLFGAIVLSSIAASAQGWDKLERDRMKDMLKIVKNEVKSNYYDPEYHGIDIEARFKKADERLNQVNATGQALGVIAQVLLDFNDSHLFFIPPATTNFVEYGWRMQPMGDKVFITEVKPGSDADKKGLKRGDQVLTINDFKPARADIWKMLYYYNALSKRDVISLEILSPGTDAPKKLDIRSEITKTSRVTTIQSVRQFYGYYDEENYKHRFQTVGDITIWKMPTFEYDPDQVDSLVGKVKSGGSLVIDLRGNGGGYVKTMERLVGNFIAKDVKVADRKGRKKLDPSIAKTRGKGAFSGKLIVLVDSQSASASEVFARVMQLEGRAKVLGDISAGAVMESVQYSEELGSETTVIPFAVSVTHADLIMSDGKSLENVGVIPDELILPTGADLAAHRDPVLARAVELLGVKVSPEDAGKFFRYYWNKSADYF